MALETLPMVPRAERMLRSQLSSQNPPRAVPGARWAVLVLTWLALFRKGSVSCSVAWGAFVTVRLSFPLPPCFCLGLVALPAHGLSSEHLAQALQPHGWQPRPPMVRPIAWIRRKRKVALRNLKRARQIRIRRTRTRPHLVRWAEFRHSFGKATLCDFLFYMLDTQSTGALGHTELMEFAMLTGFRMDLRQLHREIDDILDAYGSTHAGRFPTRKICMLNFRRLLSRTEKLHMHKAEIRRTIRYSSFLYPEVSGPRLQTEEWRSLKHMRIREESMTWGTGIIWHKDLYRSPRLHPVYFETI